MLAAGGATLFAGRGRAAPPVFVHRTAALGTTAAFSVVADTASEARAVLRPIVDELRRLESIFTLHDPSSPLVHLNRTGALRAPPPELVELLQLCRRLYEATGGVFDPTVQPLYTVLAAHFGRTGRPPAAESIAEARARIGFARVRLRPERIELEPGSALTLDGIAQGYVADRLVALARASGLEAALFDTGELAALGGRPERSFWEVEARPGNGPATRIRLRDRALAVSHAGATRFDARGRFNHILDPRSGACPSPVRAAAVVAASAALADGLSTVLCLLPPAEGTALLRRFEVERAVIVDADGRGHPHRA